MKLTEINSNNCYGRRLLAALTFLTTEQFTGNTPDEVLDILEKKAFEMYGAQYPVGEGPGPESVCEHQSEAGTVQKELSFGQLAVGLSFNPSGSSEVDRVKSGFGQIIDMCNDHIMTSYLGNTLKGMAIRACIEAQMCVVKLITFKEK